MNAKRDFVRHTLLSLSFNSLVSYPPPSEEDEIFVLVQQYDLSDRHFLSAANVSSARIITIMLDFNKDC